MGRRVLHLTFSFKNSTEAVIQEAVLYDWNGKQQKQFAYTGRQTSEQIDFSGLPSGIYILRVFDGKKWYHERVVKQ